MTKYHSIEADVEATHGLTVTAKDQDDDFKVSCHLNKFVVKILTVVAMVAVIGVVAVRGITATTTPKMADIDVDMLGYSETWEECHPREWSCGDDDWCCNGPGGHWECLPKQLVENMKKEWDMRMLCV